MRRSEEEEKEEEEEFAMATKLVKSNKSAATLRAVSRLKKLFFLLLKILSNK